MGPGMGLDLSWNRVLLWGHRLGLLWLEMGCCASGETQRRAVLQEVSLLPLFSHL